MAAWTFPVDEEAAAHPDRALPVFAVSPNWKNGVTETLAWWTEVMSSEQAVEQRRSMRRFPRRSFEYEFMRQGVDRARIENFLAGVGKRDHLVPLWHEQFKLPAGRTDGVIEFPESTLRLREFAEGDLCIVTTLQTGRYALLTVTATDPSTDTIEVRGGADTGPWPAGSRLVPVRRAKVLDSSTLDNATDRVGSTRIRHVLQQADDRFTPTWGYCSPLFRFKPDRSQTLSVDFSRSDFTLDFDTGVTEITDPGDRAQISQSLRLVLYGRENIWGFRSFLYNARGRARRFYVPTFTNDIEPIGNIDGTEFDARPNGFSEFFEGPQEARRIISFEFKDGRPSLYRTIVGVGPQLDVSPPFLPVAERFVLDAALPPIQRRDIARISFIAPSRLDQDSIEIFHPTAESYVCTTSLATRSSIVEGMPPIECWVSSKPYPVVVEESLQAGMIFTSAKLYSVYSTDALVTAMQFTAASVIDSLERVVIPPEAIRTAMQFNTAELVYVAPPVVHTANPVDGLVTALKFNSGTMPLALIRYSPLPEAIRTSMVFTSGSLT